MMNKNHFRYLTPQRRGLVIRQSVVALCCISLGLVSLSSFASESLLVEKMQAAKYSKKGAKTCLKCHKRNKTVMAIFDGVHGDTELSNSPMAGNQCETCHGPQGKHRGKNEPMISFSESSHLSTELKNSVCLSCHLDGNGAAHADREACVSCHQVHMVAGHKVSDAN